jgi:hypothetical protein
VNRITLGSHVADLVSGFTGVATARCEYISGRATYEVTVEDTSTDTLPRSEWFDRARLRVEEELPILNLKIS